MLFVLSAMIAIMVGTDIGVHDKVLLGPSEPNPILIKKGRMAKEVLGLTKTSKGVRLVHMTLT